MLFFLLFRAVNRMRDLNLSVTRLERERERDASEEDCRHGSCRVKDSTYEEKTWYDLNDKKRQHKEVRKKGRDGNEKKFTIEDVLHAIFEDSDQEDAGDSSGPVCFLRSLWRKDQGLDPDVNK